MFVVLVVTVLTVISSNVHSIFNQLWQTTGGQKLVSIISFSPDEMLSCSLGITEEQIELLFQILMLSESPLKIRKETLPFSYHFCLTLRSKTLQSGEERKAKARHVRDRVINKEV